jgi:hypothetical protein
MNGALIYRKETNNASFLADISNKASGTYFYRISDRTRLKLSGKLLKVD